MGDLYRWVIIQRAGEVIVLISHMMFSIKLSNYNFCTLLISTAVPQFTKLDISFTLQGLSSITVWFNVIRNKKWNQSTLLFEFFRGFPANLHSTTAPYSLFPETWRSQKSKSHCDWRSPIWGTWPDIYYSLTFTVLFLWGALSHERTGLSFYMLLVLASVVFLGSESLSTRDHILLSQIWDFLFVASYDSQGHGVGIRSRLNTGGCLPSPARLR
jgi:hypothetical protein